MSKANRTNNYIMTCAILAFFPWVSFNLNAYDTQPWFLLCSMPILLIALIQWRPLEKSILLFLFFVILILIPDAYLDFSHTIRSIGTYTSLCLSIFIFNRYIELPQKTRIKVIVVVNSVWIGYAILQVFGLHDDLFIIVVKSRLSETRGYSSLAAEPTFYGIFLLIQMLIINREQKIHYAHLKNKNKWLNWLWWLSLVQIVFIARSSMAILMIFVISIIWFVIYNRKLFFFFSVISGAIITIALFLSITFLNAEQTSRPLILASMLFREPTNILLLDKSVNERVSAIYVSIGSSFSNLLLPQGVLNFDQASYIYYQKSSWIASVFGNKIMSFIGSLLFELGLISFFFFVYIYKIIKSIPHRRDAIFWLLILFIVFIAAIPVGFPLTGYLLSIIHKSYRTVSITQTTSRLKNV